MSVSKSVRECYEIRNAGEWATITLACWQRPDGNRDRKPYYCGDIAIHSSFGTWAYRWTACGVPFKQFLCGLEFDYAFGKFMGTALDKFDGEATLKQIKREIIRQRRRTDLSADRAREVWDLVEWGAENLEGDNAIVYGHEMLEIAEALTFHHPMREYFADPSAWPHVTRPDSQAVGFWRDMWPEFIEELQREVDANVAD